MKKKNKTQENVSTTLTKEAEKDSLVLFASICTVFGLLLNIFIIRLNLCIRCVFRGFYK